MARGAQPAWATYKEQMDFLGFGDALWEPSPTTQYTRISIGDVAFIRRGRLFLLFSAASPLGERQPGEDLPETFEQLHVGTPEVTLSRQPGCLRTNSVQQVWTDLADNTTTTTHAHSLTSAPAVLENSSPAALENVPSRSRRPGSSFAFELTENRSGAALVTNYETYSANAQVTSPFEEYTKRHYNSWVKFGHDKGYAEDVRPILVTGFDVTRDFEMIAYSDEDTALRSGVVAPDSTVAVSHWVTQQTRSSPHTQKGPWGLGPLPRDRVVEFPSKSTNEGDIPDEFDRCIFVRYYTMRKSPARPPNMIGAGPGEHDLVSDDDMLIATSGSPGQFEVDSAGGGEEDPEGQWDYGSDNDDSELGFVVHNLPSDEDYDSWRFVADYVFKNSDAVSVLVHHRDLEGIRTADDTNDLPTLLERHKPRITVDENRVGRIHPQENQQPEGQVERSNTSNRVE